MAGSESNYGKAPGNELFGVKALPGQPGTTLQTHEGEWGGTQQSATFASYDSPQASVQAWVDLIRNHYPGAVGAPDLASFVHGLKAGGYFTANEREYLGIVQSIANRVGGDVQGALSRGQTQATAPAPVSDTPAPNVASTSVMSEAEFEAANGMPVNYSTCGPTAAAAMAASQGINLSPQQAMSFAKGLWNSTVGMLGSGATGEVQLLQRMGLNVQATGGVDWNHIQSEIAAGRPVIVNFSGHGGHFAYFDGYNEKTGAYHGGNSTGADLAGGSDWITPQRMIQLGFIPADTVVVSPSTGVGAGQEGPSMSKDAAAYRAQSDTRNCADCTMFRSPDACTLVKGYIHPGGTCKHYEGKTGAGQDENPLQQAWSAVQGAPAAIGQAAQGAWNEVTQHPGNLGVDLLGTPVEPPKAEDIPPPPDYVTSGEPRVEEQIPVLGGIAHGFREWSAAQPKPPEPTQGASEEDRQKAALISNIAGMSLGQPAAPLAQTPAEAEQGVQEQLAQKERAAAVAGSVAVPGGGTLGEMATAGAVGTALWQGPEIMDAISSAATTGDMSKLGEQAINVAIGAALPVLGGVGSKLAIGAARRLPAPGGLAIQGATAALNALRAPGEAVASGVRDVVTGGATRGLEQEALRAVPGVEAAPVANAKLAQMFRDAQKASRGPGGKFTTASVRLGQEAKRLETAGVTAAPMAGRDAAALFRRLAPSQADRILEANGLRSLTAPYQRGYQASQGLMPATIPHIARAATNMGIGGIAGAAMATVNADPNDPNYYQRVVMGGAAGMGLMLGNAYIGSWMAKDVLPAAMRAWYSSSNPMRNLNAGATVAVMDGWIRNKLVLGAVDKTNLLETIRNTWGNPKDYQRVALALEKTGQLPADLARNPEAVRAWQTLKDTWDRAVKAGVADDVLKHAPVLNQLPNGDPNYFAQFAIHHVPKDEWLKATAAARHGLSPEAMASATRGTPAIVRGPVSRYNVLSQMFKERTYANFEEGMAHHVEYDFSKLPELLASQYESQMQAMANKNLSGALRGLIVDSMRLPAGTTLNDYDLIRVPARAGVPPAGMQGWTLASKLGLGDLLGSSARGGDVYVSNPLATTLNAMFKEQGLFEGNAHVRPILRKALEMNSMGKEMVLGGSAFHMWNEINTFLASNGTGSLPRLAKIMGMAFHPGAWRNFVAANEADIRQFVYQKGTWNILPEVREATLTRGLVLAGSVAGAASVAYGGAKAAGKSDEDARKYAAVFGTLAAGLNAPVGLLAGKGWSSISTMFSDALFTRIIPAMKLMTWQLNGKTEEAALWTNESFGGENLQALLRSRDLTDLMRLTILAPDWTGSFVRQIGGAIFDNSAKGSLNRGFWVSAALNSVVMVEGLNMLLAGHPSWKNPPGQEGTVDLTPLYDRNGWKHSSPSSGEPAGVYLDVVPAWRGLLEPWKETARWGLAAMGVQNPEVTGGLQTGQPERPDPAGAWGQYLTTRGGLIPSTVTEFTRQTDFAGRPLNKADDTAPQIAFNAVLRSMQRLAPAGISSAAQAVERGGPVPVAVGQALTGLRTRQVTDYAQAQQKREWEIEHGLPSYPWHGMSLADQQQARASYQSTNAEVAANREAVRSDPNLTPADKAKKLQGAAYQFETLPKFEAGLVPPEVRDMHPDIVQQFKNDMAQLDFIRGDASGEQSADYISSPSADLNTDALFNEAWNKDATQLGQARTEADKATLRRQWLTDAANQHGIDHDVLEDFVKAKLFGEPLDALPNMSSANLNEVRDAYEAAGRKSPDDIITARALQQDVLGKYAKAFGVDAGALQRRVHLRTVAPKEQSPADQAYNRAVTVLENAHNTTTAPVYMNADGTPMGTPDDWVKYDNQLASANAWDKYRGIYINRDLEAKAQAKARGAAKAAQVAYTSPGFWDYERNFGTGRTMTDAQWAAYRAGTLDMWRDNPTPEVAKDRNNIIALYKTLTPQQRLRTSVTATFFGKKWPGMTIEAAVRDMNKIHSNAWKADQIGLPKNITNADAPPDADLSLVAPTGNTP